MIPTADNCVIQWAFFNGFHINYSIFQIVYSNKVDASIWLLPSNWRILEQKMPSQCSWKIPSFRTSSKGQCFSPYSPLHGSQRLRLTFCLPDLFVGCQAPLGSSRWDTACLWWCAQQGGVRDKGNGMGRAVHLASGMGRTLILLLLFVQSQERARCLSQNCSRGTCAHVASPSLVYLDWLISDTAQSGPLS